MSGQIPKNLTLKIAWWRRAALKLLRVHVRYGEVSESLMNGPCIVICNHVSLLDGVIIALASPRPMVFPVTPKHSQRNPFTRAVLRWLERRGLGTVVPMDGSSFHAIRSLRQSLIASQSVCIFPAGKIADGTSSQMHRGYKWLSEKTDTVVVEATISGAEHSRIFARHGTILWPSIQLDL